MAVELLEGALIDAKYTRLGTSLTIHADAHLPCSPDLEKVDLRRRLAIVNEVIVRADPGRSQSAASGTGCPSDE